MLERRVMWGEWEAHYAKKVVLTGWPRSSGVVGEDFVINNISAGKVERIIESVQARKPSEFFFTA